MNVKTKLQKMLLSSFAFIAVTFATMGSAKDFSKGPVIKAFGENAQVLQTTPVKPEQHFKVVFDVADKAPAGKTNRKFNSLARFINMHAGAGVKPENIELALVVHGKAGFDLLSDAAHQEKYQSDNPNSPLLAALIGQKVKVYLCGQSAAYYGIDNNDLAPGVEMALSAMTAHALLQQAGYTLNPF